MDIETITVLINKRGQEMKTYYYIEATNGITSQTSRDYTDKDDALQAAEDACYWYGAECTVYRVDGDTGEATIYAEYEV